MEILKLDERTEPFIWKDVTFLVKKSFTPEDKYHIDTEGSLQRDGAFEFHPRDFYLACIRRLVIGWTGVTFGGKPMPYSFDALLKQLPGDPQDDVILKLGLFVADLHGLLKKKEAAPAEENSLKNE